MHSAPLARAAAAALAAIVIRVVLVTAYAWQGCGRAEPAGIGSSLAPAKPVPRPPPRYGLVASGSKHLA
jgi:hypothetical protein